MKRTITMTHCMQSAHPLHGFFLSLLLPFSGGTDSLDDGYYNWPGVHCRHSPAEWESGPQHSRKGLLLWYWFEHNEYSLCGVVLTAVSQSAGWSALFHAAKDGHVKIVTMLVDAGADVLLKDNVCICHTCIVDCVKSDDIHVPPISHCMIPLSYIPLHV